jgi:hypothetical protein
MLPSISCGDLYLQADNGLRIRLGDAALAASKRSAATTDDDLAFLANDGTTDTEDRRFEHPLGLVDFRVDGLGEAGQSINVVVPLAVAIPAAAVYRKFTLADGWQTFAPGAGDRTASAPLLASGDCALPGDPRFLPGLNAGDRCLLLTLTDGSPNDADGQQNQQVVDPGAIGLALPDDEPALTTPANVVISAESGEGSPLNDADIQAFLAGATCTDFIDGILVPSANSTVIDLDTATDLPLGETSITFSCTDSGGNAVSADGTVTVQDSTSPAFENLTSFAIESRTAVSASDPDITAHFAAALCTDAVSGAVTLTFDLPATFPLGSTPVMLACADDAGNTSMLSVNVTVVEPAVSPDTGDGAGCFIATAAYGSTLHPYLGQLRTFRDEQLLQNAPGRAVVHSYYRLSPPLAEFIHDNDLLRAISRAVLAPLVIAVISPNAAATIMGMMLVAFALRLVLRATDQPGRGRPAGTSLKTRV